MRGHASPSSLDQPNLFGQINDRRRRRIGANDARSRRRFFDRRQRRNCRRWRGQWRNHGLGRSNSNDRRFRHRVRHRRRAMTGQKKRTDQRRHGYPQRDLAERCRLRRFQRQPSAAALPAACSAAAPSDGGGDESGPDNGSQPNTERCTQPSLCDLPTAARRAKHRAAFFRAASERRERASGCS